MKRTTCDILTAGCAGRLVILSLDRLALLRVWCVCVSERKRTTPKISRQPNTGEINSFLAFDSNQCNCSFHSPKVRPLQTSRRENFLFATRRHCARLLDAMHIALSVTTINIADVQLSISQWARSAWQCSNGAFERARIKIAYTI